MGIQSTQYVSREFAIDRIKEIYGYILTKNYRALESASFEDNKNIDQLVKNFPGIDIDNIENFTDYMLVEILDGEFFRTSLFNNYLIGVENE